MSKTPDFSARLQAALKGARSDAPSAPGELGESAPSGAPGDDYSDRLNAAIREARGDEVAPTDETQRDEAAATEDSAVPVGVGDYEVRVGDCISSIAFERGFFPDTIWNQEANADLRTARQNPDVLLPGDRVSIPEKRRKDEQLAPEQRHRFKRRGLPEMLTLRLLDEFGEPRAGEAYKLELAGEVREGFLDGDGSLREPIVPDITAAKLLLADGSEQYDLQLSQLEPIESIEGVKARLNNLGFHCGRVDDVMNERTRTALREFQRRQALPQTGMADAETKPRLQEVHGC